jgi:multidrug efflux system membrane fusion protein
LGWLIGLAAVAGLVWVLWPTAGTGPRPGSRHGMQGGTMPVTAAVAQTGDIGIVLNALGTVTPLATVTVRTQIAGQLMQLGFTEGQMVKKGDFLAQIDPRPYQAQLEQYQGQLAKDQAALADARLDLKRYQTLVKQDSLATQTLDTQAATVHQDEGTVKTDQAQVDTAKLNLIYCHITAPVSGRVGLRQVDIGNYVQTSDTNGIVVVTELQPMSVIFSLPEDNIEQVLKSMTGGATPQVTAYDRSNSAKLADGTLETLDNQIDTTTGMVKLRALFDNKDLTLFPNQFVNVTLLAATLKDAITVPSSAIQRGAPGTFVYLIKPDNTVTVRPVTLGPAQGETVAVTEGLQLGDKVVTDGADKLKDGASVTIPAEQAAAAPADKKDPDKKDKSDQKKGRHKDQSPQPSQAQ